MNITTAIERTAVVFAAVLFALTLVAGVVGALWRVTFAGVTHHSMDPLWTTESGFHLWFGLPLASVLAWAGLLAALVGFLYLLYLLSGIGESNGPPDCGGARERLGR